MAGKKRGCALENPEPCSPKVTCIGQVRVKTKKHASKLRTFSVGTVDLSFRQQGEPYSSNLQHKNQRWVHFPFTICGTDFSRLFPRRSSSSSGENSIEDRNRQTSSSCVAVFERWFVRIEGGKGRMGRREIERDLTSFNKRYVINAQPLEEGRVSICIPPKNALLMMRYRSDPAKMAALSTRLFEDSVHVPEVDDDEEEAKKNGDEMKEDNDNGDGERRKSHDFSLLFSVESNLYADDETEEKEQSKKTTGDSSSSSHLPDCLLLMICEPKLSMEVSKETWVCSTDFDRRLPERRRPAEALPSMGLEQKKRVNNNIPPPLPPQASAPPLSNGSVLQPSRSSCTLPAAAAMSMASMIEQKLVNAVAYEPFVLTRCKSVPMRTVFL